MTWGHWEFRGLTLQDTDWTSWYEGQKPLPHDHHWVDFGKRYPSLFVFITLPVGIGEDWKIPDNLEARMDELKPQFPRPTRILDIPTVLHAVNNKEEWEAIVLPLTVGTPQDAYQWWQDNSPRLESWASQPDGSRIADDFLTRAQAYVEMKTPKVDNSILPP
jgi:hypothetical protein